MRTNRSDRAMRSASVGLLPDRRNAPPSVPPGLPPQRSTSPRRKGLGSPMLPPPDYRGDRFSRRGASSFCSGRPTQRNSPQDSPVEFPRRVIPQFGSLQSISPAGIATSQCHVSDSVLRARKYVWPRFPHLPGGNLQGGGVVPFLGPGFPGGIPARVVHPIQGPTVRHGVTTGPSFRRRE